SILGLSLFACKSGPENPADKVFINGTVYTVAERTPKAEAVAVKDGMILAVGTSAEIQDYVGDATEVIDLQGMTMTPGLIESHAHLMGIGYNKLELDLMYVKTYDELVAKVAEAAAKAKPGDWITGRGWHQDKWIEMPKGTVQGFPTHEALSGVTPDNPVYLAHASGHASFVNQKALELAGISNLKGERPKTVEGGEILVDDLGNPTGILSERASGLVSRLIPAETPERAAEALTLALKELNEKGITSFHEAGTPQSTIDLIQKFKDEGKLTVRQYVMLTGTQPALLEEWYQRGPMIDTADHMLTVRSIKLNCDGALGSRGAWLLEDYSDRPGH